MTLKKLYSSKQSYKVKQTKTRKKNPKKTKIREECTAIHRDLTKGCNCGRPGQAGT